MLSGTIYALSNLLGAAALLYPLLVRSTWAATQGAHVQDAPLVTVGLVGLSLLALVVETQGQTIGAKWVAVLGVLVAIASVLRFIEVLLPLPGGFSPIFAPILLAGYVFGCRFGFLMGVFTILASALLTGGVGPWLPYQMLVSGWVGMSAGALRRIPWGALRRGTAGAVQILLLAVFGFAWGLLYGALTNLYFWPYAVGPAPQSFEIGLGVGESLARFGAFYVTTSLPWDLSRAIGNVVLIAAAGRPSVRALSRFRERFTFERAEAVANG